MQPNSKHPSPDKASIEPDWRWLRATQLAASPKPFQLQQEDRQVQATVRHLRLRSRSATAKDVADMKFPVVAAAQRLWMDPSLRSQLMILAIANTPRDEIAQHLEMDPTVIAFAEALFFDVREALRATSWIHTKVVLRLAKEGDADLAAKVSTALYGGPVVAKALCDAAVRVPKDEADRRLAQESLLHAKFTAAVEFVLTDEHRFEFAKLFIDYRLQLEKLEHRRQAFAHRCQEDIRRYELRKQRLALAAARQEVELSAPLAATANAPAAQPSTPVFPHLPLHHSQPAVKAAG
jgi:hypothetical protein